MEVVTTRFELNRARAKLGQIAFAPTMGYLHDGHLSLIRRGRNECEHVSSSIFVNPTQFGPNEDFDRYPRDVDADLHKLEVAGCDLVWTPSVEDVYPRGFSTRVEVSGITDVLEGQRRPGHFAGVTTVVTILVNAMRADVLVLGQKDAQQAGVLKKLVADLAMPVRVVVSPIVREADGVAMSSRNSYLCAEDRACAPVLFKSLQLGQRLINSGEHNVEFIRNSVLNAIEQVEAANVDYVSVADVHTLQECEQLASGDEVLLSLAVRFGSTRLIDNLVVRV